MFTAYGRASFLYDDTVSGKGSYHPIMVQLASGLWHVHPAFRLWTPIDDKGENWTPTVAPGSRISPAHALQAWLESLAIDAEVLELHTLRRETRNVSRFYDFASLALRCRDAAATVHRLSSY